MSGVQDRRVEIKTIPFADRRNTGRRLTQIRRAVLRGTYAHGWLCFESDREKRRLSPIPENWTTCSDELLEVYARHAERVAAAGKTYDFDSNTPLAEAG